MFGRKCSLCNGKHDSRKICTECGLDNSKSEKYYKINNSSCDGLPLTHVHEDNRKEIKRAKKREEATGKNKYSYNAGPSQKKQKGKGTLSVVPALLVAISVIFGLVGNLMDSDFVEPEPDYETEALYDPYEFVETELPEFGDTLMYTLKSGQYVVGVHIAEGYYRATTFGDYDVIEVTDNLNGIYLYQSPNEGIDEQMDKYMDDIRLFNGAVVTITSSEGIRFDTDNAQTGEMPALVENFVTDEFTMYAYDEAEAGVDFEPGIYDLSTNANYSYVNLTIYDVDGSEWDFRGFDLGKDGAHGSFYRNVVIPEGAIISCEDAGVQLIPSEWIWTTDYMEHYY